MGCFWNVFVFAPLSLFLIESKESIFVSFSFLGLLEMK